MIHLRMVFVFSILWSLGASAHNFVTDDPVEILSSQKRTITPDCKSPSITCDLRNFSIQVDTYKVTLSDNSSSYGSRAFVRYETGSVDQVEEFGVAQFLRGCQYSSYIDGQGRLAKQEDVAIDVAGQFLDYRFSHYIIDGFVKDPLDWGDHSMPSRHYFYQWNRVAGSVDENTSQWYGLEKPTNPALYVSDHPGTAFLDPSSKTARNISVQFRDCLYKTSDVPTDVDPTNIHFAKPIACFDWNSSFIYNFSTGLMESPKSVDSFCLQ